MNINKLKPYSKNAKKHDKKQIAKVAESIKNFGFVQPIVIDKNNEVVIGHARLEAAKLLNLKEVPIISVENLTDEQVKALRLADNKLNESEWDMGLAIEELKGLSPEMFDLTGFDADILNGKEWKDLEKNSLAESFIIPPFSVWDTRQQYWQERKKRWQRFFGDSREGREDNTLGEGLNILGKKLGTNLTGTSEFDPVISDICYRWFNIDNGKILDPFAGGTVRGVVAGVLKMPYYGIDLSFKQIEENRKKTKELDLYNVNYFNDNSENIDNIVKEEFDLLFTCPPYYDLEEYNDGEGDLSMADTYEKFLLSYESILKKSINKLKNNRFAIIIVGEIRDKEGVYRGFVKDTISIMKKAGMKFYNDIILVNMLGTAPVRARRAFEGTRKVVKTHQNILAFYKGDIEEIRNNYKFINTELIME